METLARFIRAYQRIQPLGIGELWAVPIHLRMARVENLRRLSEQVIRARHARAKADELADAFAVRLVQRLRDQDESITPALVWLDRKLGAQGTSPAEVVAR